MSFLKEEVFWFGMCIFIAIVGFFGLIAYTSYTSHIEEITAINKGLVQQYSPGAGVIVWTLPKGE